MKTLTYYSVLLFSFLSTTTAHAQKNPFIAAISIYGSDRAREEEKDPLNDLGNLDYSSPSHQDPSSTMVSLFGENSKKTDDGKSTAAEIMALTQTKISAAWGKTVDLGAPPKANALGITGGVINLDGLPWENAKKIAKTHTYPEVYTIETFLYVTYFSKPSGTFEVNPGEGTAFREKAENVYKIKVEMRLKQYDENGKAKTIKKVISSGAYVPRTWIESQDGIVITLSKGKEKKIEDGEGLTGSFIYRQYYLSLTQLLANE